MALICLTCSDLCSQSFTIWMCMFNLCALDIQWFQVLLYGGQVVSWKNERREELLFVSSKVKQKKSFF